MPLSIALASVAGCQVLGNVEAKELAPSDAGAGASIDGDVEAEADAAGDTGTSVACEPATLLDDVPNGPLPPDSRPKSSWTIDRALGTVFDPLTGLTWIDAPLPEKTYDEAACACRALRVGGFSDFRLASRYELVGILDYDLEIPPIDGPAIDGSVFRDVSPAYYWTSTRYKSSNAAQVAVPWLVGIGDGRAVGASQTGLVKSPAFCVRGGTPKTGSRFETNAETVRDAYTGLVWQRTILTRTWPRTLTPEVGAACAALTLDGATGFRVPTVKELQSLVIANAREPAIDTTAFPGAPSAPFHASPQYASKTSTNSWEVDFADGRAYPNSGSHPHEVRCVRKP